MRQITERLHGGRDKTVPQRFGRRLFEAAPGPKEALFPEGANDITFVAQDTAGNEVNLSDYRGKTVVLEWLNPDCPFVKRHYKEGSMKKPHCSSRSRASGIAPSMLQWAIRPRRPNPPNTNYRYRVCRKRCEL